MTTTALETTVRTWTLSVAEFDATALKVAEINARAEKKGFTGRVEFTEISRETVTTKDDLGIEKTEERITASLTGEAPSYGGFKFLARVDILTDGESFTLATAPGVEHVERSVVRPNECDHCGVSRYRRNTYLVEGEDGQILNVGSSCIKDFLGYDVTPKFLYDDEVASAVDSFIGGGFGGALDFDTRYVIALAYGAIRAFGFVSTQAWEKRSTRDVISDVLYDTKVEGKYAAAILAERAQIREYAAEANEKADALVEWILSEEFSGQSTYVDNLKVLVAQPRVTGQSLGILASAPQAYLRHLETAADRAAKAAAREAAQAARKTSEYLGEEGDKIEVKGTIQTIRYISGHYGTTTLYTILTEDGNLVKWFASREIWEKEGIEIALKGTVKKHEEYRGEKSTVLTRCKAL